MSDHIDVSVEITPPVLLSVSADIMPPAEVTVTAEITPAVEQFVSAEIAPPVLQSVTAEITPPSTVSVSAEITPGIARLSSLLDVSLDDPTEGDGLTFEGGVWTNRAGGATGSPTTIDAENKDGATIYAGMAVTQHSSGTGFVRADRSAYSTRAIGVATTTAAPGFAVSVATSGPLELEDWSAATGSAELPTTGPLWLGSAGAITTTLAGDGQVQQLIGEVVSPTKLAVHRGEPRIRRL